MRRMTVSEQKNTLVQILDYVDKICNDNGINYSLIGGSLIGSIRHEGFIPWDDDIDIILLPPDYKRLISLLSGSKQKYRLLCPNVSGSYCYPFSKLVDCDTKVIESGLKRIADYGVYLDIFEYHYVSNNYFHRFLHYYYLAFLKKVIGLKSIDTKEAIKKQKYKQLPFILCSFLIPIRLVKKNYMWLCYNNKKQTEYILSNWPAYGFRKEIQRIKDFESFKRVKFESIDAMICCGYDSVLKTTFGDYMTLPPKEKRRSNHNMRAFWKG